MMVKKKPKKVASKPTLAELETAERFAKELDDMAALYDACGHEAVAKMLCAAAKVIRGLLHMVKS